MLFQDFTDKLLVKSLETLEKCCNLVKQVHVNI